MLKYITIIRFYRTKFTNNSTLTVNLSKEYLSQLPIRLITFSDPTDKALHDRVVRLVDVMLELHKLKAVSITQVEQEQLQRQIAVTDQQIDELVYELYGLTEDEIAVVERED